ncbi:hypothetical protein RclHR1_19450004 [Rhizophagus clarus]|nr:hypothetical protein RclHR1_19450004 [Rhizophagus clarus]
MKANSLNYLKVCVTGIESTLIQEILPKLYKLKTLIIDSLYFTSEQLERLRMMAYNEPEVIKIDFNELDVISSIIENNGKCLKKILFRPYDIHDFDRIDFEANSLKFIRKVYENCPSIEYLSIIFLSSKKHVAEFEKLLRICTNLRSLLIVILDEKELNDEEDIYENSFKIGKKIIKNIN